MVNTDRIYRIKKPPPLKIRKSAVNSLKKRFIEVGFKSSMLNRSINKESPHP